MYVKSVNGIPKVSLPIDDLANDYLSKNNDVDKVAMSLINNSTAITGEFFNELMKHPENAKFMKGENFENLKILY